MDQIRIDGTVTFWQWQRLIGDRWCLIDFHPATDRDRRKWDQGSGGECWQTWGLHGFMTEKRALGCADLVRDYVAKDRAASIEEYARNRWRPREDDHWPEFRLAKITMSRETIAVYAGNVAPR